MASKFVVKGGKKVYECSAKGALKIKSDGILPGDIVDFDDDEKVIFSVQPRKNSLIRPAVANIDLINITIANPPKPDFTLVDKLICSCRYKDIDFFITVNKTDLGGELEYIDKCYGKICKVCAVSAKSGEGLEDLRQIMRGKFVCFAGQSAVGKTSIINALTGLSNKVGELSHRSNRGRHTTTATEILECGELLLADTPGFSSVFSEVDDKSLPSVFFSELSEKCKFADCRHMCEPDCAVIERAEKDEIFKSRYMRYLSIYNQK